MRNLRTIEIWVGVFVAGGIAALFMLAMQVSNLNAALEDDGYRLTADFDNVSGLKVRAPVTLGGVTIGRVTDIRYDIKDYMSVVTMEIAQQYDEIPAASSAAIQTAGLLGEKYVALKVAWPLTELPEEGEAQPQDQCHKDKEERVFYCDGDQIEDTESSLVLEELIGKFMIDKTGGGL